MRTVGDHAHRQRQRRLRRIAQHGAVRAHDQRQIGARGRIAREEIGGVLVARRIQQMMRLSVTRQEILQARHVAERGRADQHRAADTALDQADAAQDQRAHDALAEIGFRDQQRTELVRRNEQRLDLALGMAVDQRDATRELADLGEELARPLFDHRRDVAKTVAVGDRDVAREHHEHAGSDLAGFKQRLAVPVAADLTEPAHALDFVRRQRREGLLVTREYIRGRSAAPACCCVVCRHLFASRYRPGSSPASSRKASAFPEGAAARSLRPFACDLRRLRFSRSFCFSRSLRRVFCRRRGCSLAIVLIVLHHRPVEYSAPDHMGFRPPAVQSPIPRAQRWGREPGPWLKSRLKQAGGRPRLILARFGCLPAPSRACARRGLVARTPRACRGLLADFNSPGHAAVAQW